VSVVRCGVETVKGDGETGTCRTDNLLITLMCCVLLNKGIQCLIVFICVSSHSGISCYAERSRGVWLPTSRTG